MDRDMSIQPRGYNGLQIGLHWIIAALVLFQLLFGESMTIYVDAATRGRQLSPLDQLMDSAHYWAGWSILFLVFIRLGLGMIYGATTHAEPLMPTWMDAASRVAHLAFYALLFAAPVSNLLAVYTWNWMGDIHVLAKPVFILLIGIHLTGALFHHFVPRHATPHKMLASVGDAGEQ
jgi:cytochrome b561